MRERAVWTEFHCQRSKRLVHSTLPGCMNKAEFSRPVWNPDFGATYYVRHYSSFLVNSLNVLEEYDFWSFKLMAQEYGECVCRWLRDNKVLVGFQRVSPYKSEMLYKYMNSCHYMISSYLTDVESDDTRNLDSEEWKPIHCFFLRKTSRSPPVNAFDQLLKDRIDVAYCFVIGYCNRTTEPLTFKIKKILWSRN